MTEFALVRSVKQGAEEEILSRAGVTGVDVGPKFVKGKKTDELAIRVFVAKKGDVPVKDRIPKTIKNIKTDVIERTFRLHPLRVPVKDLEIHADTNTYDPLVGGISIGPCRSIGGFIFVGTLGAVVNDNATGDPMLLSNFHVMCVDDGWSAGDTMAQPSRVDGGNCPGGIVGELARAALNENVDAAVATHSARDVDCSIHEIGEVTGTANAAVGMAVRKRGRTTGLTYGEVASLDLSVKIDYEDGLGEVTLKNQIMIEVDESQSTRWGDNGDSGSVVVNSAGKIVGLYFAGTDDGGVGVANPIQEVMDALDVSICVPKAKEIEKKIETKEIEKKLEIKEIKEREKKREIKELEKNLKREIKEIEKNPKREIKELEKNLKRETKELEKNIKLETKAREKNRYEKGPQENKIREITTRLPPLQRRADSELEERLAGLEAAVAALGGAAVGTDEQAIKKREFKELAKERPEKLWKEWKEKELGKEAKDIKDATEYRKAPDYIGPGPWVEQPAWSDIENRLAALEGQMRHFIGPELRPDLSGGALTGEADLQQDELGNLSAELEKQASDAKQAKDNKDVEKPREG